jgi:hypothetical protein
MSLKVQTIMNKTRRRTDEPCDIFDESWMQQSFISFKGPILDSNKSRI